MAAECLRGLHEYRLASLLSTALPNVLTAMLLGMFVAYAISASLELVLGVAVAAVVAAAVYALILIRGRLVPLGTSVSATAGELLRIGLPLLVTALAIFVTTQMDLWIVGAVCGKSDVALYGASARLVALVMMPMLIGNTVLQPLVAELHGRAETHRIEALVRTTAAISGLVAVPVLLLMLVAAKPILGLVYGDYYRDGAMVLTLLCTGQAINVLAGPGAIVLMMTGGQREVMVVSLVCGLVLTVGGVLAAEPYGIVGVAAVAAITSAFHGLLCLMTVRRRNGIRVYASPAELSRTVRRYRAAVS
jgi:O-antigen/teichoic acid export membrane protein